MAKTKFELRDISLCPFWLTVPKMSASKGTFPAAASLLFLPNSQIACV